MAKPPARPFFRAQILLHHKSDPKVATGASIRGQQPTDVTVINQVTSTHLGHQELSRLPP